MTNYFRITAYEPNHDFSLIMDTYGMFEKVWQFSADLIKRGLKILEVSSDEQFINVNIDKLTEEEPDKFILRAHADGKPEYLQQNVGGVTIKPSKSAIKFISQTTKTTSNFKQTKSREQKLSAFCYSSFSCALNTLKAVCKAKKCLGVNIIFVRTPLRVIWISIYSFF